MCGICGMVLRDPARPVPQDELAAMVASLRHRGPDDNGTHVEPQVGLGFARLSIIDLAAGHQPMCNEDGTVWITFNGEVYNFRELRKELVAAGHVFATQTDTETILHLYEECGERVVDRLRGMFAFAIWDRRSRTLLCARDRFGKKPFFYLHDRDRFVFGSELKAVLAASDVKREIDVESLDAYFSWGCIGGRRSIFKGISKLLPGHTLRLACDPWGAPVERRYWEVRMAPEEGRSEGDWSEELRHELSEAVRMRLVSDVPLGAFLSGGIDSGIVVALMARHTSGRVKTFSMGFDEAQFDELRLARKLAERYGTDHHEGVVRPRSLELLPTLVEAFDEPFGDSSAIPTFLVSRFTREHVTVALSGDGGDELFAGYLSYRKLDRLARLNPVPQALRRWTFGALHGAWPQWAVGKGLLYYLSKRRSELLAAFEMFPSHEKRGLYVPGLWEQLRHAPARSEREDLGALTSGDGLVARAQELDMRTYLVDDILTKVDRTSMANSLEVRVPLLDHKVAELTFRMPTRLKLAGAQGKHILRETFRDLLPPEHFSHSKQGFAVPLRIWFRNELKEYVDDRLRNPTGALSEYVRPRYAAALIDGHARGQRDFSGKLWALVFLDAWLAGFRT